MEKNIGKSDSQVKLRIGTPSSTSFLMWSPCHFGVCRFLDVRSTTGEIYRGRLVRACLVRAHQGMPLLFFKF